MRKRILIVPGLNGSGPGHWQTIWEEKYGCERVAQSNWEKPDLIGWVRTLNTAITASSERIVLVAHSLGCLTVAKWTQVYRQKTSQIQCALLVAPPDVKSSISIPATLSRFAAHEPLPFYSMLVGSASDHYMTLEKAGKLAADWKSCFVNVGDVGHINLDSGHGPWPEGEALLTNLMKASA